MKSSIFKCTTDQHWTIRKILAQSLKELIGSGRLSVSAFKAGFYEETLELIHDVDLMVRMEMVELLTEIMPKFIEADQAENEVVPQILKHFDNDFDDECIQRIAKIFGKLLFNLPSEKCRKQNAS